MLRGIVRSKAMARAAVAGLSLGFAALAGLAGHSITSNAATADHSRQISAQSDHWSTLTLNVGIETEMLNDYLRASTDVGREPLLSAIGSAEGDIRWLTRNGDATDQEQAVEVRDSYEAYTVTLKQMVEAHRNGDLESVGELAVQADLAASALRKTCAAQVARKRFDQDRDIAAVDARNKKLLVVGGVIVGVDVLLLALCALVTVCHQRRIERQAEENDHRACHERALRQANGSMFAANTIEEALRAVKQAVRTLMPADRPFELNLVDYKSDLPAPPGIRLHQADALPPGVKSNGFDAVLVGVLPLPGDPPRYSTCVLAAPGNVLHELAEQLEALFAQLAVVLERIGLAGEVTRRNSEAYFRTLIQNASDVILIVGDDDTIGYASPSAATVFGYDDLLGAHLSALIAVSHHHTMQEILSAVRAGRDLQDSPDLAVLCADGRLLQVEMDGRDLRDDLTVRGLVLTISDVTERRRLEDDLSHLAFHDGLTGLANRVMFRNRLEQAFALAERDGSTVSVLFVDLDDFKEVNDTLGHAVGDELLVTVGRRIADILAGSAAGTAARMGGDEFAVMIERSSAAAAADIAARIVAALAVPVEVPDGLGGTQIVSGASSVGVAGSDDSASATELLRHADLALYRAKSEEKGTWQRYRPELHTAMAERLEIRAALRSAIETEQFTLMYQPIVDLHTGLIAGVESLVRWQHPTRGLLGPYAFIEVAEESGAIVDIGGWVLREALAQFVGWRREDPDMPLRYVSVNVSARQFRTPGFVDVVRRAVRDAGAQPEWLLLEITESLVLRDAEQVWSDLRTLRDWGVRIAIDDFGTGYSSLSYLREMPVDVLKLDKSFIDDILTSDQQHTLVEMIVQLARSLNLAVVAEGIEEAGQRAALAKMGCPYGQGYLFAKPAWPDEVRALARGAPELV